MYVRLFAVSTHTLGLVSSFLLLVPYPYTHTHTYIHTYIHTYTHTHTVPRKRPERRKRRMHTTVDALYVCLICMPYMYALYVCLICMPYMYALHVCLIRTPYMHALYVGLTTAADKERREATFHRCVHRVNSTTPSLHTHRNKGHVLRVRGWEGT